jgi:hypothetical protein
MVAAPTLGSAAAAPTLPAPIAQASSGKLQCYQPNAATKSCQSQATYQAAPRGEILSPATVLLSNSPVITMRTVTSVKIKAGQVCGAIQPADIGVAEFTVDGVPATPETSAQFRLQMLEVEKSILGKELCTAFIPQGDSLTAKIFVDGVPQPGLDQNVIWVWPTEGYKVQP